jgi:hypothetical protein
VHCRGSRRRRRSSSFLRGLSSSIDGENSLAGQLRLEYGLRFIDIIRLEDHGGLVLRPALDVSVEVFDIYAGFGQRLDDTVQKPTRDVGDVVAEQCVDPCGESGLADGL